MAAQPFAALTQRVLDFGHSQKGLGVVKKLFDDVSNPRISLEEAIARAAPAMGDDDLAAELFQSRQFVTRADVRQAIAEDSACGMTEHHARVL